MKIHGTAKGGALSKKDFGVAFGGGAASTSEYCQETGAQNRDLANPSGYNAIGQIFETGHTLIGKTVTKVTYYIKRGVADPLGGTVHAAIHSMTAPYADDENPTEQTASDTINADDLTESFAANTFTFTTPRLMADGDMISIQTENTTGTGSVVIIQNDDSAAMTNGVWSRTQTNWATVWSGTGSEDAQMKLCVTYLD